MLSHRESQALAAIERGITDTDPGLARRLARPATAPFRRGAPAALAVTLGVMLLAGVLALPIVALASGAVAVATICVPSLMRIRRRHHALSKG